MQGILMVISGFSGVGKGTLVNELLKRYPDEFVLSISATSRKMREGEKEGVHYFFKTKKEFEAMLSEDLFLEHAEYNGNYYGTPKAFVEKNLSEGKNVILEIESQGGFQIKAKFPEAVLFYILPPSAKELKRRLVNRGTETMEEIENRLKKAIIECDAVSKYDEILINDDFEESFNYLYETIKNRQKLIDERRAKAAVLRDELITITEKGN